MSAQLKWPFLGIVIPCFLMAFIGYNAHYFILRNYLSMQKQIWYEFSLTMIWLSYYLAIYTLPGKPVSNFQPAKDAWNDYCKKCRNYKPERAHHCKTCNQCVLAMDHHCPWTKNCVGYYNFPHFMRFLFWVIAGTGNLLYELCFRAYFILLNRNSPTYLWKKSELIFLTILLPMDGFVLLTISILFIRCLMNQIFCGRTQIETWEYERVEGLFHSKRLIPYLLANLWELHPEIHTRELEDEASKLSKNKRVRFDNLVNFPYDIDPWSNAVEFLGSPLLWLWPFGKPNGNGMYFTKNDISVFEETGLTDMLLSLPWPPDGGRDKVFSFDGPHTVETTIKDGEQVLRKRSVDPRDPTSRTEWQNVWGENLEDFGVDVDAE